MTSKNSSGSWNSSSGSRSGSLVSPAGVSWCWLSGSVDPFVASDVAGEGPAGSLGTSSSSSQTSLVISGSVEAPRLGPTSVWVSRPWPNFSTVEKVTFFLIGPLWVLPIILLGLAGGGEGDALVLERHQRVE